MFFADDQLQAAIAGFKDEAIELLDNMEAALLEIQESGATSDRINAVFRAAHTIKGSGGMLKLQGLVDFTHIAENVLDDVRNGRMEMSDEMIDILLSSKDHMQNMVMFYSGGNLGALSSELEEVNNRLINELSKFSLGGLSQKKEESKPQDDSNDTGIAGYEIRVDFGKEIFKLGMDPSNFIRFLKTVGEIEEFSLDIDAIPTFSELEPQECFISTFIKLKSNKSEDEVREVFEFIKDDIKLKIIPLQNSKKEEAKSDNQPPKEVSSKPSAPAKKAAQNETKESGKNQKSSEAGMVTTSTIRVDSEKIDSLINLIGEMVIANANVVQKASELDSDDLMESISIVSHMIEEVRESAMKIRMVQIGETFNKFKRIVHDVSKKLDKDVELVINGGETELDKTIIEKLNDPLVHIVRNALDHGIETPNERYEKGKNPKGRLELNAFHDAGTIAIEIKDDGKGLDEERILAKAIEKGIVPEDAKLSQKEIFNLIFEPGFSTASQITDISGRGVGMDVVRRNIEALRGNIDIRSELDKGSTFSIHLPLTLAIIDGFLTRVGATHYVIPLDMVLECLELTKEHQDKMNGNSYINLRGSILPILYLREFFGELKPKDESDRENIIVVQVGDIKFGLVVEELLGEFQTVIKPLGKIYRGVRGVGGATILGSGEIALIIDVPMLNHAIESSLGGAA
ncbi:MAG: chemotaxis protein CheA [Campylobacteraceae bacterium]|nr:chemotaxis protein CheA [Campylobacteraceae bacterium]